MANFLYTVKDKQGKTVKGKGQASSEKELISRLRGQGFFIVTMQKEKTTQKSEAKKVSKQTRGKRNSVKIQDLTFLARNLATMLSSGVTLLRSLSLVAYQTESLKLAGVLEKCSEDVRGGLSFEKAVKKYPNIFSSLWAGIIQVGEASGNLPFVLNRLADYLEMRMEFERKIKNALVYPAILLTAAVLAVAVFVKFIFPQFQGMFDQFEIELPGLTRFVFGVAGFFERNFFLFLLVVVLLVVAFIFLKKRPEVKRSFDQNILKVPLVSKIIFLGCIERFTSLLHILLESGLPLVYSLGVASKNIGNYVLEKQLLEITERVKEGNSLSEELTQVGIFPVLVSEMSKIGEETGNMPDVFNKVAAHYRRELSTMIERLVAAFEPLMIIFMGLVIGLLVIALFLPMFRIATIGV